MGRELGRPWAPCAGGVGGQACVPTSLTRRRDVSVLPFALYWAQLTQHCWARGHSMLRGGR